MTSFLTKTRRQNSFTSRCRELLESLTSVVTNAKPPSICSPPESFLDLIRLISKAVMRSDARRSMSARLAPSNHRLSSMCFWALPTISFFAGTLQPDSNFALWVGVIVTGCPQPAWRPAVVTFVGHQGMITKQHTLWELDSL